MRNSLLLVAALAVLPCSALVIVQRRDAGSSKRPRCPTAPGARLVQSTCTKCHGLNIITGSWGNTDAGWRELFGSMVALPKRSGRYRSRRTWRRTSRRNRRRRPS